MSSVSTRNNANLIESVAIPVGAIVVGACLFGLAKGLSALANAALKSSENNALNGNRRCLRSVAALRTESAAFEFKKSVNPVSLKTEVFRHLATQPFLVANPTELETSFLKIDRATTSNEIKTAYLDVVARLENGHQRIFATSLLEAGQRAAFNIGFKKIEALPSPLASTLRFAATDSQGKTIVTEINAPTGGDVRIETEVVGINDGSCAGILDAFDKALEVEGVRSKTPERKFTGGVCELAAVRAFVEMKITPKRVPTNDFTKAVASNNDAVKRAQRLNQKPTATNKRK